MRRGGPAFSPGFLPPLSVSLPSSSSLSFAPSSLCRERCRSWIMVQRRHPRARSLSATPLEWDGSSFRTRRSPKNASTARPVGVRLAVPWLRVSERGTSQKSRALTSSSAERAVPPMSVRARTPKLPEAISGVMDSAELDAPPSVSHWDKAARSAVRGVWPFFMLKPISRVTGL